jgi:hypothetical protein
MRFRVPELFLGCLLTVAVFSVGTLFSSQYARQTTQTNSAEKSSHPTENKSEPKSFWEPLTTDPVAAFTLGLFLVGMAQAGFFYVQLKLIRESLRPAEQAAKAAQDAATAAKTQADALMAAEGAHLYVIITADNIARIFQLARMYDNSPGMHDSKSTAPCLRYVLKNYGKTPAMLLHVLHGMSIQKDPGERRTLVARDGALEIIGVDGRGAEASFTYDEAFTFGDARSLVSEEAVLYFYGEADYRDTFGATIHPEWEFIADGGVLHQIQHREKRQSP